MQSSHALRGKLSQYSRCGLRKQPVRWGVCRKGLEGDRDRCKFRDIASCEQLHTRGYFVQAAAEALLFIEQAYDLAFYGLLLHEADDLLGA